jgi:hypothetical protein
MREGSGEELIAAPADAAALLAQAGDVVPQVPDRPVPILAFDLAALERGVERFFAQIDQLGDEIVRWNDGLRLAPWFVVTAAATVALTIARRQMEKQSPAAFSLAGGPRPLTWTWFPGDGDPPAPETK